LLVSPPFVGIFVGLALFVLKGTNMKLKDITVRNVKPTSKPQKLSDGGGLHLLVQPNGSKLWRLAYRFGNKQKTLALGVYPSVSLADARAGRDEAKKLLARSIDPSVQAKVGQAVRDRQQLPGSRRRVACQS
jgi:hypothetical protein